MFKVIPPGTVYSVDNPEFVGRIPVRTEITVLPADEPKKLGWRIQSYDGAEVFLLTSAGDVIKSPITDQEALKEGMRVSAWGGTWLVKKDEYKVLYLDGSRNIGTLSFDEDDRHCWACTGIINKRLVSPPKKITIVG